MYLLHVQIFKHFKDQNKERMKSVLQENTESAGWRFDSGSSPETDLKMIKEFKTERSRSKTWAGNFLHRPETHRAADWTAPLRKWFFK